MDDPLVTEDARALIADLTVRRQSVATAESLTAGLLAATLAGVAGASVVLPYTDQARRLGDRARDDATLESCS